MPSLLQNALHGNAAFSTLSGLSFLVASPALAAASGLPSVEIATTGAGLLGFAAWLVHIARDPSPRMGILASALDMNWVIGTPFLIAFGGMTPAGVEGAIAIAAVVLGFATLQLIGALRMTRSRHGIRGGGHV